jgi:hypothetical protein
MTTPSIDPIKAESKIAEAKSILRALGLPEAQQRDLSALILLSLLDMTADAKWSKATAPLRGTTQIMKYFAEYFDREYAPNRSQTPRRVAPTVRRSYGGLGLRNGCGRHLM